MNQLSIKGVFFMRFARFMKQPLLCLLVVAVASCSGEQDTGGKGAKSAAGTAQSTEGFYGWESVTFMNSFTRLDIVPELGGKIMGYEPIGQQILWHNPVHEGVIDYFQENDLGEPFRNTGGAKVWPAPQGKWGGPPDRVLDGLPYEFTREGSVITLTSPEDNGKGRTGLQFINQYSLIPGSTIATLNLSMKNVIDRPVEWALWSLATIPVKSSGTIYVPVDDGDWNQMHGEADPEQWRGVKNGLFSARFTPSIGKVGMKVREGWAAWHDPEREIVYALLFTVEKGADYPHGGHHFEIWSTGEVKNEAGIVDLSLANMELEVLGPLTKLNPGEMKDMEVQWAVCRCSNVVDVVPLGVISEEITMDEEKTVTGKFGVFYSGYLEEYFIDKDGNKKGRTKVMDVSPLTEAQFKRNPILPANADRLLYQIRRYDHSLVGVIAEIKLGEFDPQEVFDKK